MKKFRHKGVVSCPVYILKRDDYMGGKSPWFQDSSFFLSSRLDNAKCLYSKNLLGHFGCINAIEFSQDGNYLVSGGDDKYVQLWNLNRAVASESPTAMKTQHQSNVFCLAFDSINSKIISAGNDCQIIVHDTKTKELLTVFLQETALYGLTMCPDNDSIFASSSEDGKIKLFDLKARPAEDSLIAYTYNSFHAVQFHPIETNLLISANNAEGVVMWDIRKPKQPYQRFGGRFCKEAMSVKFNKNGSQLLALIRRKNPILFDTNTGMKLSTFDGDYYYNSCTMKSCCFAGADDEFVLSGSDDFNLYAWRVPPAFDEVQVNRDPHLVLKGHRSIVNQVRFNANNFLIASSGVEKVIKLWSPLPLPSGSGGLAASDNEGVDRKFYTQKDYLARFGDQTRNFNNDLDGTTEDLSMLAFFDALVHREISDMHSPWLMSDHSDDSDELSAALGHYIADIPRVKLPLTPKSQSVDEMLPRLITRRRHKLKLKAKLERKLASSKNSARRMKLSGLTAGNNVRLIYDPTLQDEHRLDEYVPHLTFSRRRVAPYTIMEADSGSSSSSECSDSGSQSSRTTPPTSNTDSTASSGDSEDYVMEPSTSSRRATKRMQSRSNKRPCLVDSSDDDGDETATSQPALKRLTTASPEVGPQYVALGGGGGGLISAILSSSSDENEVVAILAPPVANRGGGQSASSRNGCCMGAGCSSKCRKFTPIYALSDDEEAGGGEDESQPTRTSAAGATSSATPDSGVSVGSLTVAPITSSSSNGPSTSTDQDSGSPAKIRFSVSKAKNARRRTYRGQTCDRVD